MKFLIDQRFFSGVWTEGCFAVMIAYLFAILIMIWPHEAVVDDAEKIAAEFGYKKIPIYCDERLDEVLNELDYAWDRTTGRKPW